MAKGGVKLATGLLNDFNDNKVKEIFEKKPWMNDVKFNLITKRNEMEKLIDLLIEKGLCALDLETTGLNTRKDSEGKSKARLVGICLAWNVDEGYYVPVAHQDKEYNIPEEFVVRELKRLVFNCRCIYHNFKYDGQVLKNYGIHIVNPETFEDTFLMAGVQDASRRGRGLKGLSEKILGREMVEIDQLGIETNKKKVVSFDLVPPEVALYYGAPDAMNTFGLYLYFKKKLDEQDPTGSKGPWSIYNKIEKRCILVTMDMESNYVRIDKSYLIECARDVSTRMENTKSSIYELAGRKFDIASPKQLGEILFDEMKIKYPEKEKTASGQYMTSEKTLGKIKDAPIVGLILDYRGYQKTLGTYIENFIKNVDENSEAKFQLNQLRADTGRFSASGGDGIDEDGYCGVNCQNIPVFNPKDHTSIDIRKALVGRPGTKIVTIDYSGEELRIAANFSQEPKWVDEFLNGEGDLHSITARIIYGKPEVDKQERGVGKCVAKGTLIASSHGWVPIETLKPGDKVITHTGKLKKIDSIHDMGTKKGSIIETSSGHRITCGVNHRFLTVEDEWIRAEDLKEGQEIKTVSCMRMNPRKSQKINFNFWDKGNNNSASSAFPYIEANYMWGKLLGYLMGDGHINQNHAGVVCSDKYKDVKDDIVNTATSLGLPCSATIRKRKDKPDHYLPLWYVNVGSTIFSRFCKKIGFQGRRGKVFRVPQWVFSSSKEVMKGFLQALFETDGTVDRTSVSLCTKDKGLAQDILLLLASFGIKAYIYEKPSKKYNRIYYQIQFGKFGADLFQKRIDFISSIKRNKLSDFVKKPHHPGSSSEQSWTTKVKKVTSVKKVELWDLTVDNDHTYVAQGLVTHNTLNFLTMYGGGAGGFAQQAKIPYETAKKMIMNFFREYKGLKAWITNEAKRAKKRMHSTTFFGRQRPLNEFYQTTDKIIQSKGDRCAINSAIQGSGADILKIALYRCWKWIQDGGYQDDVRILMPIHDEIVFEIKEDKLDFYIPELSDIMKLRDLTDKLGWKVPLEVDAEYGESFHVTNDYWKEYEALKKEGKLPEKQNNPEEIKETPQEPEMRTEEKLENQTPEDNTESIDLVRDASGSTDVSVTDEPVPGAMNPGEHYHFTVTVRDQIIGEDEKKEKVKEILDDVDDTKDPALQDNRIKDRIDSRGFLIYTVESMDYVTLLQFKTALEVLVQYGENLFIGPTSKICLVKTNGEVLYEFPKKVSVDAFLAYCTWLKI